MLLDLRGVTKTTGYPLTLQKAMELEILAFNKDKTRGLKHNSTNEQMVTN